MTCNPITGKNGTHYIFQNGLTSDEKDFYKDLDMKKKINCSSVNFPVCSSQAGSKTSFWSRFSIES